MKKTMMFLTLAVTVLLLGGCTQGQELEYIGADAAKELALQAAGLSAAQVEFSGTDMGTRSGMDYYRISFTSGGETYQYDIEALTGAVIDSRGPAGGRTADAAAQNTQNTQAPVNTPGAGAADSGQSGQGNAADSGQTGTEPSGQPASTTPAPGSAETGIISVEEAKAAALAHAGLRADQVTFVKSGLDWDDGQQTYDLEFYTGDYKEYDYDVDPYTGAVLSFDFDAEYFTPPAPSSEGSLTAEEAKALALAQVPGATEADIREFEVDYDDGRLEYEGAIYYDHMEYEFEIDGYSGAIRSWEVESIFD